MKSLTILRSGPPKRNVHPDLIPPSTEHLRESVKSLGFSTDELSAEMGYSPVYVMHILRGQVPVSRDFLRKLAQIERKCL